MAGAGYESLSKNINKLHELGEVPLNVNPELLNDGSGIAETLQKNHAMWHANCKNRFSDLKLNSPYTQT